MYEVHDILKHSEDDSNMDAYGKLREIIEDEYRNLTQKRIERMGVSAYDAHGILDCKETIHTMTKTDTFYSIDGINDADIQRVRWNPDTGIGTAEIREVTYTTDPDIDQEVCQGYSDERGDYEYVRTFVTDMNEEEHIEEYDINIFFADHKSN